MDERNKILEGHRYLVRTKKNGFLSAVLTNIKDYGLWYQEYCIDDGRGNKEVYPGPMGGRAWIDDDGTLTWNHKTYGCGILCKQEYDKLMNECEPLPEGIKSMY